MGTLSDQLLPIIADCEQRFKDTKGERTAKEKEVGRFYKGQSTDWRKLDTPERYAKRLELLGLQTEADRVMSGQNGRFSPLEAIIARSELTGIAFFEKGLLTSRAIARVEIRGSNGALLGFGTGFLISPHLLMTNNHVLPDAKTASNSIAQFNYLAGVSGKEYDPLRCGFEPGAFFVTNKERDFTIVAVDPVPAAKRGYLALIRESGKASTGETVNILQHPGGERLQVVVRDNKVVNVPEESHFMQYRADTRPGSSGAPVMNDQWELAALHHAGVPKRDSQRRILLTDGSVWNNSDADIPRIAWEANEGVRISSIVAFVDAEPLDGAKKRLWEESFTPFMPMDIWPFFDETGREVAPSQPALPLPDLPDSQSMRREPDGSVSWYFRLNFGPAGEYGPTSGPASRNYAGDATATPPGPDARTRPARISGPDRSPMSTGDARRKAEELFERFQWQEAYYEESTDRREMDDYYRGLNLSAQPRQLFSALSDLLERSHATRPNYNKSRLEFLYPAADLHEDGKLQNIYSGIPFDPIEAIQRELALVTRVARSREADIGDLSLEALLERDDLWDELDEREAASPFNCEHVVPQSWFDRSEPMRGDLHHLFACETRCNSFRGNIPYWQFSPETEAVMEACGRREENKFEPKHGKGSVARATMYFLLRYPGMIGNDLRELNQDRLLILLDWHRNAAPTRYEKHRNRVIFKVQGNRNPLIDKPELASEELLKRGFAGFRD